MPKLAQSFPKQGYAPEGLKRTHKRTGGAMKKRKGGFIPLAAAAPFLAAAGLPILGSAGRWIGKKVFGSGLVRAGATRARGGRARR